MEFERLLESLIIGIIRQEADFSWDTRILNFKSHNFGWIYKTSEAEFNELVKMSKRLAHQYPQSLDFICEPSFHDPDDKIVAHHNFEKYFPVNRRIEEIVTEVIKR